jgi:hypothetical protein
MTLEQVHVVVEAVGLLPDRVVELPPYHYGALFRFPGYGKKCGLRATRQTPPTRLAPPGEKELDSIDKQGKSYYFLV